MNTLAIWQAFQIGNNFLEWAWMYTMGACSLKGFLCWGLGQGCLLQAVHNISSFAWFWYGFQCLELGFCLQFVHLKVVLKSIDPVRNLGVSLFQVVEVSLYGFGSLLSHKPCPKVISSSCSCMCSSNRCILGIMVALGYWSHGSSAR